MRRYFSELKNKPDSHKKQFAALASGTITLFIFGVWSLTTFNTNNLVQNNYYNTAEETEEIGPFESIKMNVAASFEAVGEIFNSDEPSTENFGMEAGYIDMREKAMDVYGRQ